MLLSQLLEAGFRSCQPRPDGMERLPGTVFWRPLAGQLLYVVWQNAEAELSVCLGSWHWPVCYYMGRVECLTELERRLLLPPGSLLNAA